MVFARQIPVIAETVAVVDGATTATVAGGDPPDFDQIHTFPGEGFTVGVYISFVGTSALAPGPDQELNVATYDVLAEGTTSLDFCDVLGMPPVEAAIVTGGHSIPPTTSPGSITGIEPPPQFQYRAVDAFAGGFPGTTIFTTAAILDTFGDADLTQGFSMGLSHDPAVLQVDSIQPTGELAALSGGGGPAFFGDSLLSNGWTVGVVYSFLGGAFIQFDVEKDVIAIEYTLVDLPLGGFTELAWSSSLGDPPVANVVVVMGQSIPADLVGGVISVFGPEPLFIRGDCNGDGIVNIADGVWILSELFQGGPASLCPVACDANDDGLIDASDATYIFTYRFLEGPPPPAPFPDCGGEVEPDCVYECP